jgi:hypothetical protein
LKKPFGKVMRFTGTILTFAGSCGAPYVGPLGSALKIGSNVLNPEEGFDQVFKEFEKIQNKIDDLQRIAKKNLLITAEINWEGGLKRVKAFCKTVYSMKTQSSIISHIDECGPFFKEIQNDATQGFDEEEMQKYMDFLANENGVKACIDFYNYDMALKSQFLTILVLYNSFKNNLDEVTLYF